MIGSCARGRPHQALRWTPPALASIALMLLACADPKSVEGQEDQITVPGAAAADKVVLRVYGQEKGGASDCVNASFILSSGSVDVGEMVSSKCTLETTVFSARHAPLTSATVWSDGADTFSVNMGPQLREVDLDVYIVSTARDAATWATHDVARAKTVYKNNRVGLTFIPHFRAPNSISDGDVATIGTGCDHADDLENSSVYNADRINVYVVPSVDDPEEPESTLRGFNCYGEQWGKTGGAPNIIYISIAEHSQNTLAHELGHAFGLQGSTEHTGEELDTLVPGFENHNLMWSKLSSGTARVQNHFSLGQAFRMNADERSWLNRKGAPAGALKPLPCHPTRRDDQVKFAKDEAPCPPLALDVPEGP